MRNLILAAGLVVVVVGVAIGAARLATYDGRQPASAPPAEVPRAAAVVSTDTPAPASAANATPDGGSAIMPAAGTVAQTLPDPASLAVDFVPLAGGLQNPVAVVSAGDGSGRLFVVEKVGRVRIVEAGVVLPDPFLDITDRVASDSSERGLLGLVFHPDYRVNGRFFVSYTTSKPDRVGAQSAGALVYARFHVGSDRDRAEPGSEQVIIWWEHPRGNHNGGHLAFGPRDGYLYLGTGDGGGGGDPDGNGQDATTLPGKMLRLDVDSATPYAIPTDNPYYGLSSARNELWATGLRNPWRFSFDRATGDLYIADVGQGEVEEIDFQPADGPGGENYGWNVMEGSRCYSPSTGCDRAGKELPVAEYDHGQGCSVTGGFVYRGRAYPRLVGTYFYTDWCSGRTWGLNRGPDGDWRSAQVGATDLSIQSYGEDEDGELYVVASDGSLLRVVDAAAPAAPTG